MLAQINDANGRISSLADQVNMLTAMLGSVIGHLGNASACFPADPLCTLYIDSQACNLCKEVCLLHNCTCHAPKDSRQLVIGV